MSGHETSLIPRLCGRRESFSPEIVWAHCYVVLFREDLLSLFVARTTDFNGKSKRFNPEIFFSGDLLQFPLKKISGSKCLDLPLKSVVLATNKLNKSSRNSFSPPTRPGNESQEFRVVQYAFFC